MKTLETERTLLRSWQRLDSADMFAYSKNPNVGPRAGWKPHANIVETHDIIQMFIREDDTWAIEYKGNHCVIGSVGLHRQCLRSNNDTRMLGYSLSEDYWGMGIMPEVCREVLRYAFDEMKLSLVSVSHFPFNTQSRRVIEKLGFVYEGTLRKASKRYDGKELDDVCYSMTRKEYTKLYGRKSGETRR